MDSEGVARVYRRCLNHARRVCPNDPAIDGEDVLQSAWVKVAGHLDALPGEVDRVRFLMRAVNQVAIGHRRRLAKRPALPLKDWLPSGENVEAEAIARIELAWVLALVLAGDLHAAAALLMALGWGHDGAASIQGVSPATVLTRVHRFRTKAKEVRA